MSYRPITDYWILTRAKLLEGQKYYGAFPGGFLERARALLVSPREQPVLHICSGMVRFYPYKGGFYQNDATLDLNRETDPDYHQSALEPLPRGFKAHMIDSPYSPEDANHYPPGEANYPLPAHLLKNSLAYLETGCRTGILHYISPTCPDNAKVIAMVAVFTGFNNRIRQFTVYERLF